MSDLVNTTIKAFGHPDTLIADYMWWTVLLRPKQPTLGSLILAAKSEETAFAALPADAFGELASITRDIEQTLSGQFEFEKINYLMLMMVDPHVHFHVIPRYSTPRTYETVQFEDHGWPGPPQLGSAVKLSAPLSDKLVADLKMAWPQGQAAG